MTKKITPELLRECAEKYHKSSTPNVVVIEHDLGVEHRYTELLSNMLEGIADSIEKYYVELPTDKDGKQLYIGSAVYDKDGNIYHVQGLSDDKFNLMLSRANEGKALAKLYRSSDFTITKPDSWEQIIRDAIEHGFSDRSECSEPADETAAQLIARCRKLAGEGDE